MDKNKHGLILIIITILFSLILILNYDFLINYDWLSLGYVGLFIVMFVTSATVILPLPGLAVTTLAGAFADPILIGIIGGLGSTLGELVGYYFGYGGGEIINSKKYSDIKEQIRKSKGVVPLIFIFSLIPNPLFDFVGIASGALKYPVWKFFLACLLGKIIKVALFAYAGDNILGFLLNI
jgi:membrane protein YqaA with SNARE-associated domain